MERNAFEPLCERLRHVEGLVRCRAGARCFADCHAQPRALGNVAQDVDGLFPLTRARVSAMTHAQQHAVSEAIRECLAQGLEQPPRQFPAGQYEREVMELRAARPVYNLDDNIAWIVDNNKEALLDAKARTLGGEWLKLSSWWERRG